MKFERPHILSGFVAFVIALASFFLLNIVGRGPAVNIPVGYVLIASIILGLLSFIFVYFTVTRFVYNKVKIIYKNIHDLKVGDDAEEDEVVRTTDLALVTKEVEEWADQRRTEIEDLRETEKFRREFIGNVSHELKTPIFNIQGYLLTLLDGALDDLEINRKYLKRANKSVDRMINIIEDLETISALESNRVELHRSTFDMVELVREVFEMLEERADSNNIVLRFKKNYDKPLRVDADRGKIEQVLINLVHNAIKYGRNKGYVEVRFYDMDENILIEIADNGLGIPQEDIPRIFERFYRVDKSRSREAGGTGLGLSIVKHIIEVHKQSINVRSSEDAGSTFSFTLKKAK